jgi:ribosome-binding factor A
MGRRGERLAEEIREQVARMIMSDLKDPRLGFITVTRVELAHDLGHARVHVGVLGSEAERKKSLAALQQASGFVRRELGRRLRIRHTPEIDFRYDKGLDATDRVARLLEAERQRSQAESQAPDPEGASEPGDDEGGGKPE